MKNLPAPIWKRAFAYIIDILIVNLVIIAPFQSVINIQKDYLELYSYFFNNPEIMKTFIFSLIIISALTILYWALLEYFTSQTIGKMLFKLQVIPKKGKLTFPQALIRSLSKFSLPLLIVDSINMLKSNQRYLEKISNTEVIAKNPEVI